MKSHRAIPASVSLLAIFLFSLLGRPVSAQSFNVIYNFQNSPDGAEPVAGVTIDREGNLYGTTLRGGLLQCPLSGCGTVFRLAPNSGDWTEDVLTLVPGPGRLRGHPRNSRRSESSGQHFWNVRLHLRLFCGSRRRRIRTPALEWILARPDLGQLLFPGIEPV